MRVLRTYLRGYRGALVAVVILQFVQTVATLYLPTLNADIIDNGIATGDTGYIWRIGALMLVITLVQISFAIAAVYYGSRTAMSFGRDVRGDLFHRVTAFSAQEVGTFGAPTLITRITNDVQQVQMLVLLSCTLLVAAPIAAVGGVVLAVREDGTLSLLLVVSIPVLVVAVGLIVSRMVPQFRLMQERIDGINRVLREQITGIRVVRAFVRERHESRRFSAVNTELTDTSLRAARLMALMFPTVGIVLNGSSVAVLWLGADRIANGSMSIGSLIAFLSYLTQILMAVMMATFMAILVPRAAVSADRIQEVLDTESSVVLATDPVTEVHTRGEVELRGVGFDYPGADEPVLTDISLRSGAGMTTAIIGSTGSGKTTLLNLLPRLFDATAGQVLVDGVDVRDLDDDVLRSRIGLVPQRPYLFSGTVATNLRYGKPDATDEELWEALTTAQAADFVAAMPGGLQARIQQGGTNVSGGQRQRLAIARALVRKPEIYLFDDSFSALDLATDARLRAALAPYTAESTVIVVAQRVSTIATADQILVLEDGHAVGLGSHDDLLATCPTYVEIVDSQFSAEGRGVSHDGMSGNGVSGNGDEPVVRPPVEERRGFGGRMAAAGMPAEKSLDFAGSTKRLLRRMRTDRRDAALVILFGVTSVTLVVTGPLVLGHATDLIVAGFSQPGGIDFGALHRTLLFALALYVGSAVLAWLQGFLLAGVVQRTMFRLRSDVEDKLNALPLRHVDGQSRGDLLSRVTNDIDNIAQSLQQTLSQLLTSLLTLVGVLVMMLIISPLLALVALLTIPLSLFLTKTIARRSQPRFVAQWRHTGTLNAQVEEAFTGHALVKAFGRQR